MAKSVASTELERLTPGEQYTRQELYELFNVPENKRRGNWNTGYHQYQGLWFIFATVSGPSRTGHDYENSWAEDEAFVWRGKTRSYKGQASIQSLIAPEATVLLFTREHDRDPFTFHGTVVPREVKDTVPVTVVWEIQGPERGDENRIGSTASDVPYLRNVASSEFYTKLQGTIESEMPLNESKTIECDLEKPGGYEAAVEVLVKPGEEFGTDRQYRDRTRFPARIRAAATALRDTENFGLYSISHRESVLRIKQLRDEFAPTADQAQLERATKQLLRLGTIEKPAGAERPTKVEVTASNFVRDPRVRAWVLSNADGFCEACGNRAPFSTDEGLPFLEVHHVKTLSDRGSDRTTNAVALCPNCHRRFHYSADRESFVKSLYKRVKRLLRE